MRETTPPADLARAGLALAAALAVWAAPAAAQGLSAVWANDGGDKVAQEELRGTADPAAVRNSVWDGTRISLFGARNEVVSFNLVLESAGVSVSGITVSLSALDNGAGTRLVSAPASGNGVFDWTNRPVELFFVRYLPIKGLSLLGYGTYDERHIPKRLRRPWSGNGAGAGRWTDRPDHDRSYPDIAVPLELVGAFTVPAARSQSVWADVYIPHGTAAGVYAGTLTVKQGGATLRNVPVELRVYDFALPDVPTAKTMLYFSASNVNRRHLGTAWADPATLEGTRARLLRDRHHQLAHRHRISLIGEDPSSDCGSTADRPCPESAARLDGTVFTAARGYAGPGAGVGSGVYSIGTYGNWSWKGAGQAAMNQHSDAWVTWFEQNSPTTEYFLYLADESSEHAQMETWARWLLDNPGPGRRLRSLATVSLPTAVAQIPSLDIPTSTLGTGLPAQWQASSELYSAGPRKRFFMYNGTRPSAGSFMTDDSGLALRALGWAHYKKRVNRWFYWESTYYDNFQGGTGATSLFRSAHTFGGTGVSDPVLGETGWNHSNGDGVLFYPGTDVLFPADSYGVDGPFASLRLKHWRRGLQDAEYLALAAARNPAAVTALVNSMLPKTLWEYGVNDPSDPTWVLTDVSWPDSPDAWEAARRQLAEIIGPGGAKTPAPPRRLRRKP